MEQIVEVLQPRDPFSWEKGGSYDIVWHRYTGDEIQHARDEIETSAMVGAPFKSGEWICETDWIEESNGDLVTGTVDYDPIREAPELYLAFSSLGRLAWGTYGDYLENPPAEWTIPGDLKEAIVEFHVNYGPPTAWIDDYWPPTVHSLLVRAQVVETILQYQRVTAMEADIDPLRQRMTAIKRADQLGSLAKSGGSGPGDLYGQFDLATYDGVVGAAEQLIRREEGRMSAIGGLTMAAVGIRPGAHGESSSWHFSFQFQHLTNVIWYQTIRAIVRKSLIKSCRNEQCPQPDSLFVAARPNQYYCSVRCRNYRNTQKHRQKIERSNLEDLLPG